MEVDESGFQENTQWHRFELPVDGEMAIIQYSREGDIYNLIHTEVPEQLEGRGLASRLVLKTLEFLEAGHYKMRPQCAYIGSFLKRHPEWQRLVAAE
jgi:predicted GNAT family acetyltransferase